MTTRSARSSATTSPPVEDAACLTAFMQVLGDVQATYRTFAVYAAGSSACFEQWALGVAEDAEVQHWLAGLPSRSDSRTWSSPPRAGADSSRRRRTTPCARPCCVTTAGSARRSWGGRRRPTRSAGRPRSSPRSGAWQPITPSGCSRPARAPGCACSPTVGPIAGAPTRGRSPSPHRDQRWLPTYRPGAAAGEAPRGGRARRHRPQPAGRDGSRHLPMATDARVARARRPPGEARASPRHRPPRSTGDPAR